MAPASPFERARLKAAAAWLRGRGYRVRWEPGIFSKADYLAGDDRRRRGELERALADRSAGAIFCARGGFGSMRLLESGPLPRARGRAKIFMGMSDVTVLLNQIASRRGVVTVHGPFLGGTSFLKLSDAPRARLFGYLEDGNFRELRAPRDFRVLAGGNAHGLLWGGNLSMVASTLGTPYGVPADGFLFLEEVNEPRYRLDRLLTHLALAGVFRRVKALLLGDFLDERAKPHPAAFLRRLVKRHVPRGVPVLAGIRAGHRHCEVWLPIGAPAAIDRGGKRLILAPLVGTRR